MSKGTYRTIDNDDFININNGQKFFSKKQLLDNDNGTDNLSMIENNYENEKSKRKKPRKKTLKQKSNVSKKRLETIIIDDTLEKKLPNYIQIKHRIKPLNIDFIFRRNEYNINISQKSSVNDLKKKISEIIEVPIEDFDLYLKQDFINNEKNDDKIIDLINNVRYPFFDVRKKTKEFTLLTSMYKIRYKNKVIVSGINDINDLNNIIDNFFNYILVHKDYLSENIEDNKFSVCFKTSDLAFDFHRYCLLLKMTNESFQNIKSILKLDNTPKSYKKKLNKKKINHELYFSTPYLNYTTPYISYEEIKKKEENERKKKWIGDKDFVTAIGKGIGTFNTHIK